MKDLVLYFSASGVTERKAKELAKVLGADIEELVPEKPYTRADLDWTNKQSRSTLEHQTEARPALASIPDLSGYDRIFLGFPIWWYAEPRIIDTFLDSEDLQGKTVIPFATSGGTGIKGARDRMKKLKGDADIREGQMLTRMGEAQIQSWVESL